MLVNVSEIYKIFWLVQPEPVGCSSDSECSQSQACQSRSCRNPCISDNPCSQTAICSPKNHRATCTCPPGFEGDPYRQCSKSKKLYLLLIKLIKLLDILLISYNQRDDKSYIFEFQKF